MQLKTISMMWTAAFFIAQPLQARTPAPQDAAVFIVSPRDGATVTRPVTVQFGAKNVAIVPAGENKPASGHFHLLVDVARLPPMDQPIPSDEHHIHYGKGQTEAKIDLPPGKHTLQLLLGDYQHVPNAPPVMSDKITITVIPR